MSAKGVGKMESKSISVFGYAKINLHLDITGRLDGGYHRVATVMQSVSLCDVVTVTLRDADGFSLACNVEGVPTDSKNLAIRAAELYCQTVGEKPSAHIVIDKKIPMAAGLAGGSTDAAATLIAMNRLHGERLSTQELCLLGAQLGADVPFCMMCGTAYGDGRGDRLDPLPQMPDCAIVVACGGEGVSTPWAYGLLDSLYDDFSANSTYVPREFESLCTALKGKNLLGVCSNLYNIFESGVLPERPVAQKIRQFLTEQGALAAMMSGSGPSVFGIFSDDQLAAQVAESLKKQGVFACVCRPMDRNC